MMRSRVERGGRFWRGLVKRDLPPKSLVGAIPNKYTSHLNTRTKRKRFIRVKETKVWRRTDDIRDVEAHRSIFPRHKKLCFKVCV